jgi:hypothetical protein
MLHVLLSALLPRLPARSRIWLESEIAATVPGRSAEDIRRAYGCATRQAGRVELKLTDDELQRVHAFDPDVSLVHWSTDDAARAVLLLLVARESPAQFRDIAVACYEEGDTRAQQSWLRALPVLPQPERFLPTALDACRSANAQLFEAIACDNPYAVRYFPDRNFNQLVMKALAGGIELSRVAGLSTRVNHDLARMAGDYAAERKLAGRSAPPDIAIVLTAAKTLTAS